MSKTILIILAAIILVSVGGIWLYDWVLGDTQAASEPISAPTLEVSSQAVTAAPSQENIQEALAPTTTAQQAQTANAGAALVIFEISQEESQARFEIFEMLNGSPKDVIGVTNQVAGQLSLSLDDLSTAQAGEILINARTLETDDDRRNQAIRNRILLTDQFEYIRFQPTQISGLEGSAVPGDTYNFTITGNLTIRDMTQVVTFDVSVTGESNERIVGTAKTIIQRADFNLIVPDVPFVADVGEDIILEIDLVLVLQ